MVNEWKKNSTVWKKQNGILKVLINIWSYIKSFTTKCRLSKPVGGLVSMHKMLYNFVVPNLGYAYLWEYVVGQLGYANITSITSENAKSERLEWKNKNNFSDYLFTKLIKYLLSLDLPHYSFVRKLFL